METRYIRPVLPVVKIQDYEFPEKNLHSFDNYLVAVEACGTTNVQFNFELSLGEKTKLKPTNLMKESRIDPVDRLVKRTKIWY